MKLIPYASIPLGPAVRLLDDGRGTVGLPPVVGVADEGTHLLVGRSNGTLDIRALDSMLTLVESFAAPTTVRAEAGVEQDEDGYTPSVPAALSMTTRQVLWSSGALNLAPPALEEAGVSAFGDAAMAPLTVVRRALPARETALDGEDIHGALFDEGGALWLAVSTRRSDAITFYVARVTLGDSPRAHLLSLAEAAAGASYARDGFGPARFTREDANRVLLSIATTDGSTERMRVTVAWDGARLAERSREKGAGAPESWAWPPALCLDGAPPTAESISGLDEVFGAAIVAHELEEDLGIAIPWEVPRAVVTPEGPGLLLLGADEEGFMAHLWQLV